MKTYTNQTQVRSLPTTSGLETELDYPGRTGRDGQKKKISKANERKRKVKKGEDGKVNGQGGKEWCPGPTRGDEVNKTEMLATVGSTASCINQSLPDNCRARQQQTQSK